MDKQLEWCTGHNSQGDHPWGRNNSTWRPLFPFCTVTHQSAVSSVQRIVGCMVEGMLHAHYYTATIVSLNPHILINFTFSIPVSSLYYTLPVLVGHLVQETEVISTSETLPPSRPETLPPSRPETLPLETLPPSLPPSFSPYLAAIIVLASAILFVIIGGVVLFYNICR